MGTRRTKHQHIYPKELIKQFKNTQEKIYIQRKVGQTFCEGVNTRKMGVNNLWDEWSEKGWMKEIEDSFFGLCDRVFEQKQSLALTQDDHQLATEFFLLWHHRSYTKSKPESDKRVIPNDKDTLTRLREGRVNIGLQLANLRITLDKIPVKGPKVFFPERSELPNLDSRSKTKGNLMLNSPRSLATPPANENQQYKDFLEGSYPWNSNINKKSTPRNINERESVSFVDEEGVFASRFVNGMKIHKSHKYWIRHLLSVKWGLLFAKCGEFVVPGDLNDEWVLPITPNIALIAFEGCFEITCSDVANINKRLIGGSKYWLCRDPDATMIFNAACPLKFD